MAYKVKYTTLAILKDKTIGNIPQSSDTIYTDWDIPDIKAKIDLYYQILDKKLVSVIDSIERVEGFCLPVNL
jgi:hypothetical protein